jgi:hypothetical protein
MQQKPYNIIGKRTEENKNEETPIPPTIKNIRGNYNQNVLNFQIALKNKPIEYKNYRQENRKSD